MRAQIPARRLAAGRWRRLAVRWEWLACQFFGQAAHPIVIRNAFAGGGQGRGRRSLSFR
jgi:hypothetical protein